MIRSFVIFFMLFISSSVRASEQVEMCKEKDEVILKQFAHSWEELLIMSKTDKHFLKKMDAFANLSIDNDTIIARRLISVSRGAYLDCDGVNYFQELIWKKMGSLMYCANIQSDDCDSCDVCSDENVITFCKVMFYLLSKELPGDQFRFWSFYWSSPYLEEDQPRTQSNSIEELELNRLSSLMGYSYLDVKNAMCQAYNFFNHGVLFMSDYKLKYHE